MQVLTASEKTSFDQIRPKSFSKVVGMGMLFIYCSTLRFKSNSKLSGLTGGGHAQNTEFRRMDANRVSKQFIYFNRTFFGLYNLLHELKASKVKINNFKQFP